MNDKQKMNILICGDPECKLIITNRLQFELDGFNKREMEKLKELAAAEALTKNEDANPFKYYYNWSIIGNEERDRMIAYTTSEFFTERYHYTTIQDSRGRIIENIISGNYNADVALIMVSATNHYKSKDSWNIIQKNIFLTNLFGFRYIIIVIDNMESGFANYEQGIYEQIKTAIIEILVDSGWNSNNVPIIPISAWNGDNIIEMSTKMHWWIDKYEKYNTLCDILDKFVEPRNIDKLIDKPLRFTISGVYKIKGAGDVMTGRSIAGEVKPKQKVKFIPSDTNENPCRGEIDFLEYFHKKLPSVKPGENVGISITGLSSRYKPKRGNIMVLEDDESIKPCKRFTCELRTFDKETIVNSGETFLCMVKSAKVHCKLVDLTSMFAATFEPCKIEEKLVVQKFSECESLGRVLFMDKSNNYIGIGQVTIVEY